jgi:hypothetical protein
LLKQAKDLYLEVSHYSSPNQIPNKQMRIMRMAVMMMSQQRQKMRLQFMLKVAMKMLSLKQVFKF